MAAGGLPPLPARTYEEYLECQVTARDLRYLESEAVGRQLVELGFCGSGDVLRREEFEARAAAAPPPKSLASVRKELKDNFLQALADREEANRTGNISSIIFIRDRNSHCQEVSAYIDYAHRLTTDDFEVYFSGKKRLFPRNTDLRSSGKDISKCPQAAWKLEPWSFSRPVALRSPSVPKPFRFQRICISEVWEGGKNPFQALKVGCLPWIYLTPLK
ncbi:cilia- and flagella-associated protein 299 isoform X2 [Phalacrocorax carbo]|uniref:cilia- and flagella-associated protein 299 isoform X2 n=1 Tax=Phalacrocorax carbo TaxID=9209 RepID=UPI003119EED0